MHYCLVPLSFDSNKGLNHTNTYVTIVIRLYLCYCRNKVISLLFLFVVIITVYVQDWSESNFNEIIVIL